MEGIFD